MRLPRVRDGRAATHGPTAGADVVRLSGSSGTELAQTPRSADAPSHPFPVEDTTRTRRVPKAGSNETDRRGKDAPLRRARSNAAAVRSLDFQGAVSGQLLVPPPGRFRIAAAAGGLARAETIACGSIDAVALMASNHTSLSPSSAAWTTTTKG